jgi:hypothetical protein
MTNRKKPAIVPGTEEMKNDEVSGASMSGSPLAANSCANRDVMSSVPTQSPSTSTHNLQITEQRKARRFRICSPATIRWLGSDGAVQEAVGTVRDISTCGVFVEASVSLRTSDNVELEIVPFGLRSDNPKTELHFEGKIVRNEQRAPRPGFALAGFLWLAKLELHVC